MSHPLPAGDVLNEAFQFGLRRWGTVIRYAWLPAVLSVALVFLYFQTVFDVSALEGAGDSGLSDINAALQVPSVIAVLLGIAVFASCLFLYSGFAASIYRLVALGEERSGFANLRTDGPAVRAFWAILILSLLTLLIMAIAFFLSLALTGQSLETVFGALREFLALAEAASASGDVVPPAAIEALGEPLSAIFFSMLLAFFPLIYVNVRLTPFAAGSAAEDRILLFGAFQLTVGRFWPVFLVTLLTFLFLLALSIVAEIASAIFSLLGEAFANFGGVAAAAGGIALAVAVVISIAYQVFATAVQLSVHAIIYRRLKTGE